MKELSIKQKAKAYDEALKVLKEKFADKEVCGLDKSVLQKLFPQLKESEDERTWIINYLSNRILNSTIIAEKENLKKAIAWLEKQGKNNMGISEATKQKLEDNLNKALEKETPESWNEFLDEQKPAETEKGVKGNDREIPNSAWSEEDEEIFNVMKSELEKYIMLKQYGTPLSVYDMEWFKSLKDRYTWKPSEAQVVVVDDIIRNGHLSNANERIMCGLLEQLKKLRGE